MPAPENRRALPQKVPPLNCKPHSFFILVREKGESAEEGVKLQRSTHW